MHLSFGCDSAGRPLVDALMEHATALGHTCVDCGCFEGEPNDYPIYGERAARKVLSGECTYGIIVCGTGVGISLSANKMQGIRCALCAEPYTAKLTRAHNDANMLALGARTVGPELAKMILDFFLETPFEGGRHQRRVDMITRLGEGGTLQTP